MRAYFDFFTGAEDSFKVARQVVRKYEFYPVIAWRILFLDILDQLNEFDGEGVDIDIDNEDEMLKKQNYKASVKKEPFLSFEVEGDGKIVVEAMNLKQVTIKYYIIDVEILFSRAPFLKENTEEFSYVKPFFVVDKDVPQAEGQFGTSRIEVPPAECIRNQNMVVEVNGGGKQVFKTHYSTSVKVQVIESYGQLKVTDKEDKPLP